MFYNAALSAARDGADKDAGIITERNFRSFLSPIALEDPVEVPGLLFNTESFEVYVGRNIGEYSVYVEIMRALGVADEDSPQSISFYPNSFDHKADIENFIQTYTQETYEPV